MILTTYGRRRIPTLWRLLERNISTKKVRESLPATASHVGVLSQNTLPAPKIRALISLYHQVDSWVTPENLYQKIDEAFVPSALSTTPRVESMASVSELKTYIRLMRHAPKMAQWDSSSSGHEVRYPASSDWSESGRNKRDLKVIEALYGVAFDHGSKILPGLEVLQELAASAINDHHRDEDDRKKRLGVVLQELAASAIKDHGDDRKAEDVQDVYEESQASHSENLPTHG